MKLAAVVDELLEALDGLPAVPWSTRAPIVAPVVVVMGPELSNGEQTQGTSWAGLGTCDLVVVTGGADDLLDLVDDVLDALRRELVAVEACKPSTYTAGESDVPAYTITVRWTHESTD